MNNHIFYYIKYVNNLQYNYYVLRMYKFCYLLRYIFLKNRVGLQVKQYLKTKKRVDLQFMQYLKKRKMK